MARSAHIHQPDTTDPKAEHELTVGEVAAVLGISTNVVYYWIERHHVEARRGPGGRLFIAFGPDVEAACRARIAARSTSRPIHPKPHGPRTRRQYEAIVPNTADRVAQTAAAMLLEEKLEPIFHPDSYGYRPGRSRP